MKLRSLIAPLTAITIVITTSLLTYRVFSVYQSPDIESSQNQVYTLVLPDQEYAISLSDIEGLESDLIIPSLDDTTPLISYDPRSGVVKPLSSVLDYRIALADLNFALTHALQSGVTTITPTYSLEERMASDVVSYNLRLNKIYRTPLSISLKDGSTLTDLTLSPDFIRSLLVPISVEANVPPEINRTLLIDYVTKHLTPKQKKYFSADATYQNTRSAINARFMGDNTPQVLGVDDGPTSSGNLAERYLEVDLSQQKMYFFISGTLYKEYHVSTGAEYPTPVGEYKVLNKAPLAFSNIYDVWMPYWMGFSYARDVGAYLGLHEIAYDLDERGKPVYNHGYYIGDMMTGGCVAMEPKDSREIYNLSPVGMLVRVVE